VYPWTLCHSTNAVIIIIIIIIIIIKILQGIAVTQIVLGRLSYILFLQISDFVHLPKIMKIG